MLLIEARKNARYSQEAVAGLLGVSRPTYRRMEEYPETITIAEAKKLADIFDVDVEDIFFADDCNLIIDDDESV